MKTRQNFSESRCVQELVSKWITVSEHLLCFEFYFYPLLVKGVENQFHCIDQHSDMGIQEATGYSHYTKDDL